MFTWLNKQGVRSDKGFEFQRSGRFTAEYSENGRTVELYVEGGAGGVLTVYEGSLDPLLIDIENPFERKAERNRIVNNIKKALEFQGMRLDLATGPEPSL